MFSIPRPILASKFLLNLLELPATDILSLFLFAAVLGHCLFQYTTSGDSNNLIWTCLLDVSSVHFWNEMFLCDLDMENFRKMIPQWVWTLNAVEPEMRLLRLAGKFNSGFLLKGFNTFYRTWAKLWSFSHIAPARGFALSILIGLYPNTTFVLWRFIHVLHFLRPFITFFEAFLVLLWIQTSISNIKRDFPWRLRFVLRMIDLAHFSFFGTELSRAKKVEGLAQYRELQDETITAIKLLFVHWAASLPIVRLLGSIYPTPISKISELVEEILGNKPSYKALLNSKAKEAQLALDVLQKILDNRETARDLRISTRYAMMRLCTASGTFPQRLILRSIRRKGREPFTSGGCGEIWKGSYRNLEVSLKVAKLTQRSDNERLMKDIAREAILWSQLEHPNILPLFGVHPLEDAYGRIALVSPWEGNGNISSYLERNTEVARFPLIFEILAGLQYLHDHNVVHGDLKGANILISSSGQVRLADFGISSVVDVNVLRWTSLSTMTRPGGTIRWMAPELVGGLDESDAIRPTFASDVYSFASVAYEILTGQLPFHEFRTNVTVMSRIIQGMKPTKPLFDGLELSFEIWTVMENCWNPVPDERPTVSQVTDTLRNVNTPELTTRRAQVWKNDDQISSSLQSECVNPTPYALRNSQFTMMDAIVLAKYMVFLVLIGKLVKF